MRTKPKGPNAHALPSAQIQAMAFKRASELEWMWDGGKSRVHIAKWIHGESWCGRFMAFTKNPASEENICVVCARIWLREQS